MIRLGLLSYDYFSCNGDIPKNNFEVKYSNAIVQYLTPTKIPCYLPYCGIGLNQDSFKYTYSNHNPGELPSPRSNKRK